MATSWSDYEEMRDAAAAADRMLIENYNYRFVDVVLDALERQRAGAIGETVTLDVSMTVGLAEPGAYNDPNLRHFGHDLPGGAMFNFASHPASVLAATMESFGSVGVWRGRLGEHAQSDDELRAIVGAERCAATITLTSRARPSSFTIALRGTEGVLEVDVYNRRLFHSAAGAGLQRLTEGLRHGFNELGGAMSLAARYATARHDYFIGLGTLLERFYAAVAGQAPPPISTAEMDMANALLFALVDPANAI
jgi:predicted dehydrogenase